MLDSFTSLDSIKFNHIYELSLFAQILTRNVMHPSRNSGTEQNSLELLLFHCLSVLLFICLFNDLFNIITESHIQHPVCFIKNEGLDIIKDEIMTVDEINASAGSADDNITSSSQFVFLVIDFSTSINSHCFIFIRFILHGFKFLKYLDT